MSWARKPRILVMGDSPRIHTGFATVIRKICDRIAGSGKHELAVIGWFDNGSGEAVPYGIRRTKHGNGEEREKDKYAHVTFDEVCSRFRPDLVLAVGDAWMVTAATKSQFRNRFKLVLYIPIDSGPIYSRWADVFQAADQLVLYGKYGVEEIAKAFPNVNKGRLAAIPHGVDLSVFKPPSPDERVGTRATICPNGDKFIVGTVARNQPRKNLPALIRAFSMFSSACSTCMDCGSIAFGQEPAKCACGGLSGFHRFPAKEDTVLYIHAATDDIGWDLVELAGREGVVDKLVFPRGMKVGMGVDVETLGRIIGSFDVWALPTTGEGFCFPPGSMVECKDGKKPIEDVTIGEEVVTHVGRLKKVTETFSRRYCGELSVLSFDDGVLECTPKHLLYSHPGDEGFDWREASSVEVGNGLFRPSFVTPGIVSAKSSRVYEGDIYNLEVEDDNSYTVSGVAVHNCLPALEAMACGAPMLITNYSAHLDFCADCAELIRVAHFMTEPRINAQRALVDELDFAMRLDKMYMEDKDGFVKKWRRYLDETSPGWDESALETGSRLRSRLSGLGLERAKEYAWGPFLDAWMKLFDMTLGHDSSLPSPKPTLLEI
jgi:hypothetical protein